MSHAEHHSHDHHHDHDHHGHHRHDTIGNISLAFFLNLIFAVIEIVGGVMTNSLAILSNAIHDLGDSVTLGASWYFERKSNAGGDKKYSYGYRRFSLLGALVSSIVLVAGTTFILARAIPRLIHPQVASVQGMMLFAVLGVAVNGFAALRLRSDRSFNARVVGLHLLEDVLGWLAVLIIAAVMHFADVPVLDPVLSVAIAAFVLVNVVRNLMRIFKVFLQAIPDDFDLAEFEKAVMGMPGVTEVHNIHVWSLDGDYRILTMHVMVERERTKEEVLDVKCRIKAIALDHNFAHVTLDIEYGADECLIASHALAVEAQKHREAGGQ
jgi:cobalt-zinc-cadmium efflux system protein